MRVEALEKTDASVIKQCARGEPMAILYHEKCTDNHA